MFTRPTITLPEVNGFGRNFGHSEYIVQSCLWQIWGAICAEARTGQRTEICFFFVWSSKKRTTLPISGQPNCTKVAHNTWICVAINHFGKHLWKFTRKGSFFQKVKNFKDFGLQAVISPKCLQIAETHDGMADLRNVRFPSVPLESTQSDSRGLYSAQTERTLSSKNSSTIRRPYKTISRHAA